MERILVSACLLGQPVRYDGKSMTDIDPILQTWMTEKRLVIVCPEMAGGLSTPRPRAEIQGGDGRDVLDGNATVITEPGIDVSTHFLSGAEYALSLCREYGIRMAVLKAHSPSCGSHEIHDGRFSGTLKEGHGVTAALLQRNGIRVFDEHELLMVAALLVSGRCRAS